MRYRTSKLKDWRPSVFWKSRCSIPKAMVGWERRMWNTLTEREVLSALEHLRIEIQVHSTTRCCENSFLIY